MITAQQIRAARGLLDWNQEDLAEKSGVARGTVKNLENNSTSSRKETLKHIKRAFEDHGLEFLPNNGVREKHNMVTVIEGENEYSAFMDDIYKTVRDRPGTDILIHGLQEDDPEKNDKYYELSKMQIERLVKVGVKEKLLVKEGDTNFIAPKSWYRYLPGDSFIPIPIFTYGDKIAISTDTKPYKTIIINEPSFAKSFRCLFEFAWSRAIVPD